MSLKFENTTNPDDALDEIHAALFSDLGSLLDNRTACEVDDLWPPNSPAAVLSRPLDKLDIPQILGDAQVQLDKLQAEKEQLNNDLQATRDESTALQAQCRSLQEANHALLRMVDEAASTAEAAEASRRQHLEEAAVDKHALESLQETCQRLEAELAASRTCQLEAEETAAKQHASTREALSKEQVSVRELTSVVEQVRSQAATVKQEHERKQRDWTRQLDEARQETRTVSTQLANARREVATLTEALQQLEALGQEQSSRSNLEAELAAAQQQAEAGEAARQQLRLRQQALEEALGQEQSSRSSLEAELAAAQRQAEAGEAARQQLRLRQQALEEALGQEQSSRSSLEAELAAAQQQAEAARQQLRLRQQASEALQQELRAGETKLAEQRAAFEAQQRAGDATHTQQLENAEAEWLAAMESLRSSQQREQEDWDRQRRQFVEQFLDGQRQWDCERTSLEESANEKLRRSIQNRQDLQQQLSELQRCRDAAAAAAEADAQQGERTRVLLTQKLEAMQLEVEERRRFAQHWEDVADARGVEADAKQQELERLQSQLANVQSLADHLKAQLAEAVVGKQQAETLHVATQGELATCRGELETCRRALKTCEAELEMRAQQLAQLEHRLASEARRAETATTELAKVATVAQAEREAADRRARAALDNMCQTLAAEQRRAAETAKENRSLIRQLHELRRVGAEEIAGLSQSHAEQLHRQNRAQLKVQAALTKLRQQHDTIRTLAQREAALRRKAVVALREAVDVDQTPDAIAALEVISLHDKVARLESELDSVRVASQRTQKLYEGHVQRMRQQMLVLQKQHLGNQALQAEASAAPATVCTATT